MKAWHIDAENRRITEVDVPLEGGNYQAIYPFLGEGVDCFDVVRLGFGDGVYIDDEGLLKEVKFAFTFVEIMPDGGFYAGNGLVLGSDHEGESTPPRISLDALAKRVRFCEVHGNEVRYV